jgi:hypothetical protein
MRQAHKGGRNAAAVRIAVRAGHLRRQGARISRIAVILLRARQDVVSGRSRAADRAAIHMGGRSRTAMRQAPNDSHMEACKTIYGDEQ